MKKKLMLIVLVLVMMIGVFGMEGTSLTAFAAEAVVYDAANMSNFQNRTRQTVANKYSEYKYAGKTYVNGDRSTWFSVPSSTSSPYNAGVLTEDTHKAVSGMANFYRWLVGVKPLKRDSVHSASMQAQALDRNFEFNHFISNSSKPEDMPQEMWDEGYACAHSVLAGGYTPQGAITGWMNEGYSISSKTWGTIGHRMCVVSPYMSELSFGYSGGIAVGGVAESDNTFSDAFAAFPAPGSMPSEVISPNYSAWSVYFNTAFLDVLDQNAVQVTVRNLNNGSTYCCTEANDMLKFTSAYVVFAQPEITESRYTDSYSVEITGLTDVKTGKPAVVKYTVDFFDVSQYAASPVVTASAVKTKFIIYKSLGDTAGLKKIASALPQEIVVTSELGEQATIKANGPWVLDEANSCFVNSADPSNLPDNFCDPNNKLKKAVIHYSISDSFYDAFNSLNLSKYQANEGESITFSVYRTNMSTDSSQIFQLKKKSDGTYYGVKRFDSAMSSEFDAERSKDSMYHYYVIDSATPADQGEYLSIYYASKWYDEAYVSTSFAPLTVNAATGDKVGISSCDVDVRYRTHIQTYGWEADENDQYQWKKNGTISGTTGQSKRLEGINVVVTPKDKNKNLDLGIQYTTHCQSYGWLPWSADGEMNGTQGEAKRLEAIKIQLKGKDAAQYDVYYRVHAQSYGWLGWAKNGQPAGTAGLAKRLEGIQILIVKKGENAPSNTYGGAIQSDARAYISKSGSTVVVAGESTPNVAYRTHVQTYGWQGWKYNGQMSGTQGQGKRLEGINISLTNKDYTGGISYITHVQSYGWQGDINNPSTWKSNGEMSGTSGKAKRLEAICIKLTGEMEKHYDVYYRVHAQTYGWLAWASNGQPAGTAGLAKRLEGIQIVLVPKGQEAPGASYGGVLSQNGNAYIHR